MLLRFHRDLSALESQTYRALVTGLGSIEGVSSVRFGTRFAGETRGYEHAFLVAFSSTDSYDSYREHPAHRRLGDFTRSIGDDYLVFDFAPQTSAPVA